MKAHTQTIINVALTIAVTLLIYQNKQLKDGLVADNWFAQHSVDQTLDRMDKIEAETTMIKERVGIAPLEKNKFGDTPVYRTVNERLTSYALKFSNIEAKLDEIISDIVINEQISDMDREDLIKDMAFIEKEIIKFRKQSKELNQILSNQNLLNKKSLKQQDIEKIIEGCTTNTRTFNSHNHKIICKT